MSSPSKSETHPILIFLLGFAVSTFLHDDSDITQFLKYLVNILSKIYTVAVFIVLAVLYFWRMTSELLRKFENKSCATDDDVMDDYLEPQTCLAKTKSDADNHPFVNLDTDTVETEETSTDNEEEEAIPKPESIQPSQNKLIDLNGTFRLEKNTNFQQFLACQGVGWALRAAADRAVTTHHITHKDKFLKIRVGGIISSETVYTIDGQTIVQTKVKDRVYDDSVTYTKDGTGVMVTKVCKKHNYKVFVVRKFSPDKQTLTVTSTALFPKGKKVEAIQRYQRLQEYE